MLRSLYLSCVRPTLGYATCAWGSGVGAQDALCLECLLRAAARVITGSSLKDKLPADLLLARAGLEPLSLRRKVDVCYTISRLSRPAPKGPPHLVDAFQRWIRAVPSSQCRMQLRSGDDSVRLPRPQTELLRHSPFYLAMSTLNSIPAPAKQSWASIKSHLLSSSASS